MNKAERLIKTVSDIIEAKYISSEHKEGKLKKETDDRNISGPVRSSIVNYSDTGYEKVNNHLRRGMHAARHHKDIIEDLKTVTNHPTKHSIHVYRGISHMKPDEFKKGQIIHDKGFTSTSLAKHKAQIMTMKYDDKTDTEHTGTLFKIHAKRGTKGAYIGHMSEHPDEKEFLLHSGTKFVVHSKGKDPHSGEPLVNLHIHSQED